ncbi:MAG TPA: 4-alpha-glucanotransferase, partial [Burkholderiaceae bacterium]|nr:4-alpha-glucanotransferase [Burkholderiaceae bacterium]
ALAGALGALGPLPIIAEDLGVITPDVEALRDHCGFPGMRILQFAFGDDATNPYLPHRHTPASVVYTGTHDNDTTRGWWQTLDAAERAFAAAYLGADDANINDAMLRAAYTSVANLAIVPMQDVLGLDATHRMNLPGSPSGHWAWRFDWSLVGDAPARTLARLARVTGRLPSVTAP